MGASGWEYVVAYQQDLASALDALRRQVFAEGGYVSPSRYGLPAPASIDELTTEMYWEFMGTCGTHSIIDVLQVVPAENASQGYGTVRPLTVNECRDLFGTAEPDRADYERVSNSAALFKFVTAGRGTGRAVVLWAAHKPSEIVFWGYSGD